MTTTEKVLLAAGISVATTVVSLAVVTVVLIRLPATYFVDPRHRTIQTRHPAVRILGVLAKNLLGLALVALGIILMVPGVPGQGLLTVFLGVMLLDFPGKYRLERWLLRRPLVNRGINRLRAKFGKPDLQIP